MKRITFLSILGLLFALQLVAQPKVEDYTYKIKVEGLKDTVAYLANYYGPKLYYKDTAEVDANGNFVFNGAPLEQGIYAVVLPDKSSYFEMIVAEKEFSLETKKGDLITSMKVKGSVENENFYQYLNYINEMNEAAQPLKDTLQNSTNDKNKERARNQMREVDTKVKAYQKKFKEDHADLFITKVFKASDEPVIPETPLIAGTDLKDSTFPRRYYMNHYFDGVDFQDERLIRCPVVAKRVEKFMDKIVVQHPDSLCAAAHMVINKTIGAPEMYKYFTHNLTNKYEKSKIMGMDAVFVCIAESYYSEEKAFWADSAQVKKIQDAVVSKKPLLIGKPAPNIVLQDTAEKWHVLQGLESPYTILFFWDPGCGHCKKAIPPLLEFYHEYKSKGIEVFAVCTEFENEDWKKFVHEKELDWINVSDSPEYPSNFRTVYDIFSTPQLYVLDGKKEIIAKKLGVEQLADYFDKRIERDQATK